MSLTVAEYAASSFTANDISNLYCLPGLQLDPFFDAVYDLQRNLNVIHTRHEQGAAYMALGAALATGKPQAYAVVPGAGFLNSTAALSTALATHARVMAFVGEIPLGAQGKGYGVLHEIPDGLGIMERLTKDALQVSSKDTAAETIDSAWCALKSGAPKPVGLSVPMNFWQADTGLDSPIVSEKIQPPAVDLEKVSEAAKLIAAAQSPMIVVGSGAMDSSEHVAFLSEVAGAPVVAFRNGQGVMSADNPMQITMPVAHELWPAVDLVIGLGTRMQSQLMAWGCDDDLSVIHITLDENELGRIVEPTVGLCADLADVLPELFTALEGNESPNHNWKEKVRSIKEDTESRIAAKLQRQLAWLGAIRAELPRDGILVDEITQMGYVGRFGYPVYEPRTLITPGYQATLGYGYATALGVAQARSDVPVVNFCGDGGALFTLNEIATGVLHKINLTTVIFADGHYGNVRGLQRDNYQARYIANELANPDFAKFAESFGAQGLKANTPEELRCRLRDGMAYPGPTIIEVSVGEFNSPWEYILMPKNRGI